MVNVSPFLLFNGNCAEVMTFYHTIFQGELTILKVAESPLKDQIPKDKQQLVLYARLKNDFIDLSATDWMHPTRQPRQGNTVCLFMSGGNYDDLKVYFDKLAAGGDPALLDPLVHNPTGVYGHVADKYGIHWFFHE